MFTVSFVSAQTRVFHLTVFKVGKEYNSALAVTCLDSVNQPNHPLVWIKKSAFINSGPLRLHTNIRTNRWTIKPSISPASSGLDGKAAPSVTVGHSHPVHEIYNFTIVMHELQTELGV